MCTGRPDSFRVLGERVARGWPARSALGGGGVKPGDRVAIMSLNSDRYIKRELAQVLLGRARTQGVTSTPIQAISRKCRIPSGMSIQSKKQEEMQ